MIALNFQSFLDRLIKDHYQMQINKSIKMQITMHWYWCTRIQCILLQTHRSYKLFVHRVWVCNLNVYAYRNDALIWFLIMKFTQYKESSSPIESNPFQRLLHCFHSRSKIECQKANSTFITQFMKWVLLAMIIWLNMIMMFYVF